MATKTAAELNELLAAYRALELGRPFPAKFAGRDTITDHHIHPGTPLRMLRGQPLLQSGIDVLTLAHPEANRFVDDIEGDGVYYVVNKQGASAAVRFEVKGEMAYVYLRYGDQITLKQLRSQRLRHKVALVASAERPRAVWR